MNYSTFVSEIINSIIDPWDKYVSDWRNLKILGKNEEIIEFKKSEFNKKLSNQNKKPPYHKSFHELHIKSIKYKNWLKEKYELLEDEELMNVFGFFFYNENEVLIELLDLEFLEIDLLGFYETYELIGETKIKYSGVSIFFDLDSIRDLLNNNYIISHNDFEYIPYVLGFLKFTKEKLSAIKNLEDYDPLKISGEKIKEIVDKIGFNWIDEDLNWIGKPQYLILLCDCLVEKSYFKKAFNSRKKYRNIICNLFNHDPSNRTLNSNIDSTDPKKKEIKNSLLKSLDNLIIPN